MRILIELPSWLGDTVMATPAIENLIRFHSKEEITLVGSSISIETLKNHPKISNTYVLDKKYSSIFVLFRELDKFDKFFTFRNSFRSNLFKWAQAFKSMTDLFAWKTQAFFIIL